MVRGSFKFFSPIWTVIVPLSDLRIFPITFFSPFWTRVQKWRFFQLHRWVLFLTHTHQFADHSSTSSISSSSSFQRAGAPKNQDRKDTVLLIYVFQVWNFFSFFPTAPVCWTHWWHWWLTCTENSFDSKLLCPKSSKTFPVFQQSQKCWRDHKICVPQNFVCCLLISSDK